MPSPETRPDLVDGVVLLNTEHATELRGVEGKVVVWSTKGIREGREDRKILWSHETRGEKPWGQHNNVEFQGGPHTSKSGIRAQGKIMGTGEERKKKGNNQTMGARCVIVSNLQPWSCQILDL